MEINVESIDHIYHDSLIGSIRIRLYRTSYMNLHVIYVISLDVCSPEFCVRWLGYGWRTSSSCVEQVIYLGIITSKSTTSQYWQQLKTSLKALFQFCFSFLCGHISHSGRYWMPWQYPHNSTLPRWAVPDEDVSPTAESKSL